LKLHFSQQAEPFLNSIFHFQLQYDKHIYSDSLGMEEPNSLGYVLINPPSHIKRNFEFN